MFGLFTRNKNKISFHFISNFHISRISRRGNNRKRCTFVVISKKKISLFLFLSFLKRSSSFFHKKLLAREKDPPPNAWRIRPGQAFYFGLNVRKRASRVAGQWLELEHCLSLVTKTTRVFTRRGYIRNKTRFIVLK